MARSDITYTWLPLDEWGRIMGYNLWEFNNWVRSSSDKRDCGATWFQNANQSDNVSRDELAVAIQTAEQLIADYVGYNLLPTWDRTEVIPQRFKVPGYTSNVNVFNRPKSIKLPKAQVYALGQMAKTIILADAAITRISLDGDTFLETASVTVPNLTDVDPNEVRVYYPNTDGSDGWEIRPIKISGNVITFPAYLIPKRNLIDGFVAEPINSANDANYLTVVDVYRVYNDTTNQATLVYNEQPCINPPDCTKTITTNCGYVTDGELGYVVYNPLLYVEPDQVWVNYYSGARGNLTRALVEIDPYWQTAIAYLAAGLIDKELHNCCGGKNPQLASKWQDQLDERTVGKRAFLATQFMTENPFGLLTRGAWFAYQRAVARRI